MQRTEKLPSDLPHSAHSFISLSVSFRKASSLAWMSCDERPVFVQYNFMNLGWYHLLPWYNLQDIFAVNSVYSESIYSASTFSLHLEQWLNFCCLLWDHAKLHYRILLSLKYRNNNHSSEVLSLVNDLVSDSLIISLEVSFCTKITK